MFHLMKSPALCQATKSWKSMFSEVFCCQAKNDSLFSPARNSGYQTFKTSKQDEQECDSATDDNRTDLCEHSVLSSPTRPASLVGIKRHSPQSPLTPTAVLKQPSPTNVKTPILSPQQVLHDNISTVLTLPDRNISTSSDVCHKGDLHYTATPLNGKNDGDPLTPGDAYSVCSSSGVSSGMMSHPSSMEFSMREDSQDFKAELETVKESNNKEEPAQPSDEVLKNNADAGTNHEIIKISENGKESEIVLLESEQVEKPARPSVLGPIPRCYNTEDELNQAVQSCSEPLDVLSCVHSYNQPLTPLMSVSAIHQVFLKTLAKHPRNSPSYNKLCGDILTNRCFRDVIANVEANCKGLNNYSLLMVASDLLYLRLTLKQATIPTLLSHVDFESMDLSELRLLASCLHTPNIPLINSEYMYNVSAAVATKHIDKITDLYTLLNIMKCFGRYFSNATKRQCEVQVVTLSAELDGVYPDGRSMAAHMFDAFYRMEHAPMRPLLQQASLAITQGDVPVQPQDISAVLRYCVKFGYSIQGNELLDKLSTELHKRMPKDHASQFTTNVKWLTVFYYYNESLMTSFVENVMKYAAELDFVALSDVMDALAQVYFVPENADEFFDCVYNQMMLKLPTLSTSHVHSIGRKLLFTAYHFAVFGRYPVKLIELSLNEKQFRNTRASSRMFLRDVCKAVSIERPDLLPSLVPNNFLADLSPPKMYAFERDVQSILERVVNGREYFSFISSPLRSFPLFLLRAHLDGSILPAPRHATFIPPHMHQQIQNIAVVPLPRSRFCIGSRHATGKTRLVLRLLRAQGARVVTVPHFNWDGNSLATKVSLLRSKIFEQKTDDVTE